MHRGAMQADQHCRRFFRSSGMAKIIRSQRVACEFSLALAALPQEIRIEILGCFLRDIQEFGQRGRVKSQQHGGCFYLGAFSVGRLYLKRGSVVGENCPNLEGAFLFVKNIHELIFCGKTRKNTRLTNAKVMSAVSFKCFELYPETHPWRGSAIPAFRIRSGSW